MRSPLRPARRAALIGLIAILGGTARAPGPGPMAVHDAWTRPTAVGMNGAGYLTIKNQTGLNDRLLRAGSPAATSVTLHESRMASGVMIMRPLSGLAVPAGATVALVPGGRHLMLSGLHGLLKLGRRVPVDLVFAHAGRLRVYLTVRLGPPGDSMAGMKM